MDRMIIIFTVILLLGIAYLIGVKGQITLLHSYHYKYVKKEDIKPYTKRMGLGLCMIACNFLIFLIIDLVYNISFEWIIWIGSILALSELVYTQYMYNGSIFSLRKPRNR